MYAYPLCRRQIVDAPPAHLQAEEADYLPEQCRLKRQRAAPAPMDIDEIAKPCGRRPRLLRVPRPVSAPCFLCPQSAEEHTDCEEGEAHARQVVNGIHLVLSANKLPKSKKHGSTRCGICKHIYDNMWCEPRTLQGWHQRLVMYLWLQDVYADEDGTEQRAERKHPTIVPAAVGKQTDKRQEEGIPKPRFAHCAQGWALQREPHQHNVSTKDEQTANGQGTNHPLPLSQKRKHGCCRP